MPSAPTALATRWWPAGAEQPATDVFNYHNDNKLHNDDNDNNNCNDNITTTYEPATTTTTITTHHNDRNYDHDNDHVNSNDRYHHDHDSNNDHHNNDRHNNYHNDKRHTEDNDNNNYNNEITMTYDPTATITTDNLLSKTTSEPLVPATAAEGYFEPDPEGEAEMPLCGSKPPHVPAVVSHPILPSVWPTHWQRRMKIYSFKMNLPPVPSALEDMFDILIEVMEDEGDCMLWADAVERAGQAGIAKADAVWALNEYIEQHAFRVTIMDGECWLHREF